MADHTSYPVEPDTLPRRILFLGDEAVGKTTFIRRYCEYMRDYYRCESYRGQNLVSTQFLYYRDRSGNRVPILFLDLPAGLTEESRRDQYPNVVNLVVLCFSVDNPFSLANVWRVWLPEFRRYLDESTRFYLLGLKCNIRNEMSAAGRIAAYSERAKKIHKRFEFRGDYLECSVEENPGHARHCMDILINDASLYAMPPFRVVD